MESKRNRIVGAFWFIYIILLNFSASLSGWILFPWYDCWSCGTWIDIWRFVYGVGNWQFSLEKSSNSICICNLHTAYNNNNNNTLSTCKCKSLWNIPSVHIHRTVDRVKIKLLILFICGLYSSCFPLHRGKIIIDSNASSDGIVLNFWGGPLDGLEAFGIASVLTTIEHLKVK